MREAPKAQGPRGQLTPSRAPRTARTHNARRSLPSALTVASFRDAPLKFAGNIVGVGTSVQPFECFPANLGRALPHGAAKFLDGQPTGGGSDSGGQFGGHGRLIFPANSG